MNIPGPRTYQSGFTLIEILISIGIIAGVAAAITFFGLDILGLQIFISDELQVEQEVALTLRVMSAELRSMGPADHGGYPIAAVSSSSLTFYSDVDGNGKFEQVRYFLDGTTFKKGVIVSSGTPPAYPPANEDIRDLVHNVISTNIYTYYDNTYTGATGTPLSFPPDISRIRMIRTSLSVDRDVQNPPAATTGAVNTAVRNLRTF